MERTKENALHLGRYAGINVICDPEIYDDIENHFASNGMELSKIICFSAGERDRLAIIFEIMRQSQEVAKAIMGLLNRNDIEIEMHCTTADGEHGVKSVKLRKVDDVGKCLELLDKCAAISVRKKEPEKGGE